MKKHVCLLMMVIGIQQVGNAASYTTSIEGITPFSATGGSGAGRFEAMVKRVPDKSEVKSNEFSYAWGKSGGNSSSFTFSSTIKKIVYLSARTGVTVSSTLTATISCTIKHPSVVGQVGKPDLSVAMTP